MSRVAIISDIHGNRAALEAALARAQTLDAGEVICLGDVVNPLPESQAVFEELIAMGIPILRGNHEDYIVRCAENPDDPINRAPNFEPVRVLAGRFDPSIIDKLKRLPMTLSLVDRKAGECLLCHASPSNNRAGWRYGINEALGAELEASRAKVFVCGHWHDPETREWRGKTLVTNGSVGVPLRGRLEAEFLILEPIDGEWRIEHHAAPYDSRITLRAFQNSGLMEAGGPVTWLFHEEIRLAERRLSSFFKWASARGHSIDTFHSLAQGARAYLNELGAWHEVSPFIADWLERTEV